MTTNRKITEKQKAFADAYYTAGSNTFGNGAQSAKVAGYKGTNNYLARVASENVTKCKIIDYKMQIQAETAQKYEHNQDIAFELLRKDYANLEEQAAAGNVQAIQARTAIVRELNSITGQHSSTIHSSSVDKPDELTQEQIEELRAMSSRALKVKLANG